MHIILISFIELSYFIISDRDECIIISSYLESRVSRKMAASNNLLAKVIVVGDSG